MEVRDLLYEENNCILIEFSCDFLYLFFIQLQIVLIHQQLPIHKFTVPIIRYSIERKNTIENAPMIAYRLILS